MSNFGIISYGAEPTSIRMERYSNAALIIIDKPLLYSLFAHYMFYAKL
jgi:hypothetical protein